MAESPTPVFKLIKPDIGGSKEVWGNRLNKDLDDIDAILFGLNNAVYTALQNGLNTQTLKQYDSSGNVIAGSSLPATDVKFRTASQPLGYAKAITDDLPTFFPNDKPGYIPPVRWVLRMMDLMFPVGTIVTWYGQTTNIPAGWMLCQGGTVAVEGGATGENVVIPDLRGRFILGAFADASTSNPQFKAGGSNAGAGDFSHDHEGSVGLHTLSRYEIPPHVHYATSAARGTSNGNFFGRVAGTNQGNWNMEALTGGEGSEVNLDGGNVGPSLNGVGSFGLGHSHTLDVFNNTTPGVPWWTLCYIIKIRKWETFV